MSLQPGLRGTRRAGPETRVSPGGKGVDQLRSLEGAITPPDCDLRQHARVQELIDTLACRLE